MERFIENAMYASRWLLAPIYFGLSLGLLALALKFFQEVFHVIPNVFSMAESDLILVLLSLIDMALVGGLLVMVMISGYENFVSELDIDDIILRGGDYKYTYICDYDNSDYGYDKELGKWFAWATFEMEDSEVEWLRNLLSADTVIMRFEGTDYSKFDYTWTVQDRQAITDIIDLYDLLKAVTPEVREKALRN